MKGIYEIRLSWKFQHKLITCSKVKTAQGWQGKLKMVLFLCPDDSKFKISWKSIMVSYKWEKNWSCRTKSEF